MRYVNETGDKFDFTVKYFGHAGDGNLHIYTCSNDMELDEFKKQVDMFMSAIYKKAMELGGQISASTASAWARSSTWLRQSARSTMQLMQGIKKVFDPKMILNPGKVCCTL